MIVKVVRALLLLAALVVPATLATADAVPALMLLAYWMVATWVGSGDVTVAMQGVIAAPV